VKTHKIAILSILLFSIYLRAWSQMQTERGTTVVIDVAKDKVIIAADSRGKRADGSYRDDDCKISAFDNKIIFASAGLRHGDIVSKERTLVWDSHDVAVKAFKMAAAKPLGVNNATVSSVAHEWMTLAQKYFLDLMQTDPQLVLKIPSYGYGGGNSIVQGVFVGKDRVGHVTAMYADVQINRSVPTIESSSQTLLPGELEVMGHHSVVPEFYRGSSLRAMAEVNEWKRTVIGKDASEQRVMLITQLVKWSVLYEPEGVGGDVDTAVFDSSGVHWIYRKANCKASE